MRILYADPIVDSGYTQRYVYYDGLYKALRARPDITLYVQRKTFTDYDALVRKIKFKPDVVLFGLGWFSRTPYFKHVAGLDRVRTVVYMFKPQCDLNQKLEFCAINKIKLIITPVPDCDAWQSKSGVRTVLFPYGLDTSMFHPRPEIPKKYDVGFSGALHGSRIYSKGAFEVKDMRAHLGHVLHQLKDQGVSVFWKASDHVDTSFINDYAEYAKTINAAKMWLGTLAPFGDVPSRHFQVLGSGTLLLCQRVPASYRSIFRDGENCIEFDDTLKDFENKVRYYMAHPEELQAIVDTATREAHTLHSWEQRVTTLLSMI